MFYPSIEIRWFRTGSVSSDIQDWFRRFDFAPLLVQERTDTYLRTHDDAMGIKLREGIIEIKQRQERQSGYRIYDHVHGQVERWYKWSFSLADAQKQLPELSVPAANWIDVEKKRMLILSGLTEEQQAGYQVELTAIRVAGQDCWSFAVEVTAGLPDLQSDFEKTVTELITVDSPAFSLKDSFGYAELLNKLELGP